MAKLNIEGYKKIEGLRLENWVCDTASEFETIYTFLFNFSMISNNFNHLEKQYCFNIITIHRDYLDPDGFKIEVDFHIEIASGVWEKFTNVKTRFVYAHNLITLTKFKEILNPLLKMSV
jgi:hypothetical protein